MTMNNDLKKMTSLADNRLKRIGCLLDQIKEMQGALALNTKELYEKELYEIGDLINLVFWQSCKLGRLYEKPPYKSKATLEPF